MDIKFKVSRYMELRKEANELINIGKTIKEKDGFVTMIMFNNNKLTQEQHERLIEIENELNNLRG